MTQTDSRPPGGGAAERDPLVSVVIATYGRPDALVEAVESVLAQSYDRTELVVVGDSTDDVMAMFEAGGRFDEPWIRFQHLPERTSPAQSRNEGLALATGSILVQIDDDALFADSDALGTVVDHFQRYEDVGALAFQSQDRDTGRVRIGETPDPPTIGMEPTEPYRAPNFVGVGAAIRRAVLDRAGTYPDEFGYGFEDIDLSLRVHDAGYDILYTPEIVVYHEKSDAGRIPDRERKERLVENRINIAVRNLPWRYVVFTALVWSVYVVAVTRSVTSLRRVFGRIAGKWDALVGSRTVVDAETIGRMKSRKTMLFGWWYGPHPGRIVGPDGDLSRLTRET